MKRQQLVSLFPCLALAIFPILFLFAHNRQELLFTELWLPLIVAALSALGVFVLAFFILRDTERASVLASAVVVAFWYYGFFYEPMFEILKGQGSLGQELSRNRTLLLLWLVFWGAVTLTFLKLKPRWGAAGRPVILALSLLILFSAGNIALYEVSHFANPWTGGGGNKPIPVSTSDSTLPDIYYLIPDGRANSEILSEFFGYDDSAFRDSLRSKGFHIVKNSTSNYPSTRFSLPSTFNMEYLSSGALEYTRELAENSKAVQFLKERGYKFVFVGSGSSVITGENADYSFTNNDFHRIVQSITILGPLTNPRSKVLNAFSDIEKAAEIEGPKFVIVHILIPHVPYIFGENGEYIGINPGTKDTPRDMELYLGQLKFADKKFAEAAETIMRIAGPASPVIVIQSDHGVHVPKEWVPDDEERPRLQLRNFAAYYLPEKDASPPSDLSAVNTFRFLFDLYFSQNFGFLENKHWPSGTSF